MPLASAKATAALPSWQTMAKPVVPLQALMLMSVTVAGMQTIFSALQSAKASANHVVFENKRPALAIYQSWPFEMNSVT